MRRFGLGMLVVGVVVLASLVAWQHRLIVALRAERDALAAAAAQLPGLRGEVGQLTERLEAGAVALEAAREDRMRLKDRSARLRQLEVENARLLTERTNGLGRRTLSGPDADRARLAADRVDALPAAAVTGTASSGEPAEIVDLGVVTLVDRTPVRLALGRSGECLMTPTVLEDGRLRLEAAYEMEVDGVRVRSTRTATVRPGETVAQFIGGVEVLLVPRLTGP